MADRKNSVTTRKPHLLLGMTGSVASIKVKELVETLTVWAQVRLIFTTSAERFFGDVSELESKCEIFTDANEWEWRQRGDKVLHIELRDWADAYLLAPLSANSLAKLSLGLCDNLVTSVARAWDFERPLILAPAMNTKMWEHPITNQQIETLQSWGCVVIQPEEKELMCGEVGMGAMAELRRISHDTQDAIRQFG